MGTIDDLVRDLRGFDANKTLAKALRKEIAKPVPEVRDSIRRHAVAILPAGNGLGDWVAASKFTAQTRISGNVVTVTMRGGRSQTTGKKSDLKRLDQGALRHPSWGRRKKGQWFAQRVTEGFFTDPVTDATEWREAVVTAVDRAFKELGRG